MSNRFSHIKNRNRDVESFIEKANDSKKNKLIRCQEEQVLLSIASRMNRDKECKKVVLLHVKKDIISDIDKYCHGNKQAILNYLLRRGLDTLIKEGKLILI